MVELTAEGQRIVDEAARRHGLSASAVQSVLEALVVSGGGMAQFNHPELGGMGQWSTGGMIMIGDMFNNALKARVAALCSELSAVIARSGTVIQSGQWQSQGKPGTNALPASSLFIGGAQGGTHWWPDELGAPSSTGAQNNLRYACFPDRGRLAIDIGGRISVYDTGDHRISGFAQQQGGDQSLTFTSQHGTVRLDSLHLVSAPGLGSSGTAAPATPPRPAAPSHDVDVFSVIERLGALRDKGLISDAEFAAKKTELLGRL